MIIYANSFCLNKAFVEREREPVEEAASPRRTQEGEPC